ncbi:MAG: hypothetical protein RQ867_10900 [Mariprofundaceae bacterium]|nr:hypothetical protein [Mariprofundaceae bacterium]
MTRHQNYRIDSSGDVVDFVQRLLNRYEVAFDKIILLRPIKKLVHESDKDTLSRHCQIKPVGVGKCYVIISENLLEKVEESGKEFLWAFGGPSDWKSPITFYLLVEIAHYKWTPWSDNRCEQWAINELCSGSCAAP